MCLCIINFVMYKELIENTKNVRLGVNFSSNITEDFEIVSVSLCHVVFRCQMSIFTLLKIIHYTFNCEQTYRQVSKMLNR